MNHFIILQGSGTGEAHTYPDSLEWVSILFCWHVAGNFILFILSLLLCSHLAKSKSSNKARSKVTFTCTITNNSSPHSSSASFHHHSPATVQTNVSPTTVYPQLTAATSDHKIGLPGFSYFHGSDLTQNEKAMCTVQQQNNPRSQLTTPGPVSTLSQAYSSDGRSDQEGHNAPIPVIVEATPRDSVILSDEYRTLSREDELRASIKLKESSLI